MGRRHGQAEKVILQNAIIMMGGYRKEVGITMENVKEKDNCRGEGMM